MIIAVLTYLSAFAARVVPRSDEDGQGLVEYGLILILIAIVSIAALTFFGGQVSQMLSTVGKSV